MISKIDFVKIKKTLRLSCLCIAVISIAALVYGRMAAGFFTLAYLFPANFLVGAIVIMAGLVVVLIPTRLTIKLKDNKLIDHSNYAAFMMEKREQKRRLAHEFIYLGMSIITITALVQLFLSWVIWW